MADISPVPEPTIGAAMPAEPAPAPASTTDSADPPAAVPVPPSAPLTPARDPRRLAQALIIWGVAFLAAVVVGPLLPAWPASVAYFLASLALIGLAVNLVIGFQHLVLHRTTYLLLGALGLAATLQIAQPHCERTRGLNLVCGLPGELLTLTGRLSAVPFGQDGINTARNSLFGELSGFVEPAFAPESWWRVLILGLAQLLIAAGVGLWIGFGIDEIGHLIPIALVAGLADIWSVSAGATAVIITSPHIHYFLLRFPMLGGDKPLMPFLIGLTDFLFFAIFYTAAVRFALPQRRTLNLLLASFVVTVALALFFQVGLPVLPFMAVLFVAGNWHHLRVKHDDLVKVGLFLLVCGAVAFGLTILIHGK
ncbi:MAG TPA: hypothetical protein PKO06_16680 [Candidatus Ozemobacteraceae bacterium]|nr:hypothetical protein [Candidatus Ozemobacteraceae bacterium]